MGVKEAILRLIKESVYVPEPISEASNIYTDLGFDSLSFVTLLTELEETYCITFDIAEMETCTNVGRLIAITQSKVKERDNANA